MATKSKSESEQGANPFGQGRSIHEHVLAPVVTKSFKALQVYKTTSTDRKLVCSFIRGIKVLVVTKISNLSTNIDVLATNSKYILEEASTPHIESPNRFEALVEELDEDITMPTLHFMMNKTFLHITLVLQRLPQ